MTRDTFIAEALTLPVAERLAIVERLMDSLLPAEDDLSNEDWRESWADEAERRLDRVGPTVAADEVHAALLRRFRG